MPLSVFIIIYFEQTKKARLLNKTRFVYVLILVSGITIKDNVLCGPEANFQCTQGIGRTLFEKLKECADEQKIAQVSLLNSLNLKDITLVPLFFSLSNFLKYLNFWLL